MVALEEVPLDAFRTTNLKGLPMEKARGGGGRASPTRRTSYMVSTPDRKTRTTPRSNSPAMMMNSGGLNASSTGEGLFGEGAAAREPIPEGATGMEDDMEGDAGPSITPRSPGPGTPPTIIVPGDSNTIDDEQFFPELPEMLNGLAERLSKVCLGTIFL